MNFDDYDDHILHKYRLAVAIAIVKNTPENCTPSEHLENLRKVILTEMEEFDPDMTICEDDFNFNDDDCTNNDNNTQAINDHNEINETQFNDSQTNDSVTILKDFEFNEMVKNTERNNDRHEIEMNSVPKVLRILKGIDDEEMFGAEALRMDAPSTSLNHTQSTYYQSSQSLTPHTISFPENAEKQNNIHEAFNRDTINPKTNGLDKGELSKESVEKINITTEDSTFYDSQKTIIYSLHGFTDNYTHVSQSQTDYIVVPKYLLDKSKTQDYIPKPNAPDKNTVKHKESDLIKVASMKETERVNSNIQELSKKQNFNRNNMQNDGNKHINNDNNDNLRETNEKTNSYIPQMKNSIINDSKKHKNSQENTENFKSKRLRNVNNEDFESDIAYFNEVQNQLSINKNTSAFEIEKDMYNQNTINITNNINSSEKYLTNIGANIEFNDSKNSYKDNTERNPNKLAYYSQKFSQFSQEFSSAEPVLNSCSNEKQNPDKLTVKAMKMNKELIEETFNKSDEEKEEMFDKLTDSQTEVVPFKVLEELSKVKSFLSRTDRRNSLECVSDSGYKSDSQSRSSFKTLHSSNTWLNQSAHTLMSFIIQCPLVANTTDITNEISRTLGHLIDRLHLEEKYPSFLEEHLEAVEGLIKGIFEDDVPNNQLLKKDESIHRLFLLNKSSHIIRFSIEKIIKILEEVDTKLSDEELFELTHTNQSENLAYIFHVLETFIKKLIILKHMSSQNSTQSQDEEVILKKSCITDIWRKKWNYTKKVVETNVSAKQCVLVQCSDVLNKIIVKAMDGYSLISFYALQCFNLLQN